MRTVRRAANVLRAVAGGCAGPARGVVPAATLLSAACSGSRSILRPDGPAAEPIVGLWWILIWTTGIVTLIVFGLFAYAVIRARRASPATTRVPGGGTLFVAVGGAVIPAVILVGLVWSTLDRGRDVALPAEAGATSIEVVGHQFWWEVRYPEAGVVTANEIHIPAGRPVRITLTSTDVIHSFWAPTLAGKLDLVPGRTNELWLQTDTAGVYRGQCAEFCGVQHAKMGFLVIAQTPADFAAWLERQRRPAAAPAAGHLARGRDVFIEAECVNCHVIRGVNRIPDLLGMPGPDLTHFGGRRTIAAATVPNRPPWLSRWILAPDAIKRGSRMPASPLSAADLNALVAYLESLR